MKKLFLLCCAALCSSTAWGMAKTNYSNQILILQKKEDLPTWFKTIDPKTLPLDGTTDIARFFTFIEQNDAPWIAEFLEIPALKKLLLSRDNIGNTFLHHLAESGSDDALAEIIPLLPELRAQKNNAGKTPYDVYIGNSGEDEKVQELLDPSQGSSTRSRSTSLKDFDIGALLKITKGNAQEFIDELNEKSVPTTGDTIGLAHFTLSEIKDPEALKIVLKSPKLKGLLTAKNPSNSETILHIFADKKNVTADEIQLLLDLGIDKKALRKSTLFGNKGSTAADLYKERPQQQQDSAVAKLLEPTESGSKEPEKSAQKKFSVDEFKKQLLIRDLEGYLKDIDPTSFPKEKSPELREVLEHIAKKGSSEYFLGELLKAMPQLLTMADTNGDSLFHHIAREAVGSFAYSNTGLKDLANYVVKKNTNALTQKNSAGKTALDIYLEGTDINSRSSGWYTIFSGSNKTPFRTSDFSSVGSFDIEANAKTLDPKTIPTDPERIKKIASDFLKSWNLEKLLTTPVIFEHFTKPNKKIIFEEAVNQKNDRALETLVALGLVPDNIDLSSYPAIDRGLKALLETAAKAQGGAFYLKTLLDKETDELTEYLNRIDQKTLPQPGTAEIRTLIEEITKDFKKVNYKWFIKLLDHPKMAYLFSASDDKGRSVEAILVEKKRDTLTDEFKRHKSYTKPTDNPATGKSGRKPFDLEAIIDGSLLLDDVDPATTPEFILNFGAYAINSLAPEKLRAFLAHPTTRDFINKRNVAEGQALIHYIADSARDSDEKDMAERIRILVEAGSDLTELNNENKTPLTLYTEKRFGHDGGSDPEIIALLTPRPLNSRIATFAEALHSLSDKIGGTVGLGMFD